MTATKVAAELIKAVDEVGGQVKAEIACTAVLMATLAFFAIVFIAFPVVSWVGKTIDTT